MSKKRNKSPAVNAVASDNKWETIINSTELNSEKWSHTLAVLAPECFEDSVTIDYINKAVAGGLRRKFTLLSEEILVQLINEHGNSKNKKGKDSLPNSEICEVAKNQLDKDGIISVDTKAKVIKWFIMIQKESDLKVNTPKKAVTDGKASKAAGSKKDRSKSGGTKKGTAGGGGGSPEPPSVKKDSKLRKRGDPDPDIPYIDDEPDDGSSRYFIMTGQIDPLLIESMAKIGCVTSCVVKVTRDIHIQPESSGNDPENSPEEQQNNDELERRSEEIDRFWNGSVEDSIKGIMKVLNGEQKSLLDTPIVGLEAKHLMFPITTSEISDEEEMKTKCSMDLFEMLACLLYDLLDKRRQWQNYLTQSKLINLPEKRPFMPTAASSRILQETPGVELGQSGDEAGSRHGESRLGTESKQPIVTDFSEVQLDHYHDLMKDVPTDLWSVHLQMDAMLNQVEVSLGDKDSSVDNNLALNDTNNQSSKFLDSLLDKIYLTQEQKAVLLGNDKINNKTTDKDGQQTTDQSSGAIHSLDEISIANQKRDLVKNGQSSGKNNSNSNGQSNENLLKELKILIQSFRHLDLIGGNDHLDEDIARKRAARMFDLLTYLDQSGLSKLEIDHAIRVFLLESISLTGTDENGIICNQSQEGVTSRIRNQLAHWDDPFLLMDQMTTKVVDEEHELLRWKKKQEERSILEQKEASMSKEVSNLSFGNESGQETQRGILKSTTRSSIRSRSESPISSSTNSALSSQINSRSNSRSRRRSSVRFDNTVQVDDKSMTNKSLNDADTDELGGGKKSVDGDEMGDYQKILLDIMENIRKRSFTEWCFEEFYEPHVLLQIVNKAIYKNPFVDIYHLRQQEAAGQLLMVLNNPFHDELRMNYQPWGTWLHSNIGFRNYLEHVAEKITDWTRDQEAIYQAKLLNQELEKDKMQELEKQSNVSEKETPRKGAKSKAAVGKKTPARSRSGSRGRSASRSSGEEKEGDEKFSLIVPGSLKAQKLEKEKLDKQQEEEEKKKEEKRVLSARKKAEKDAAKASEKSGKESKRPGSKSSGKSKGPKKSITENTSETNDKTKDSEPKEQVEEIEEYWPFHSYDLGDSLVHYSGEIVHLFPDDGNLIRINRTRNVNDSPVVHMSLITNSDHIMTLHVIGSQVPPENDQPITDDLPNLTDQSNNSDFYCNSSCVFDNGICIVSSLYCDDSSGAAGVPDSIIDAVKSEIVAETSPSSQRSGKGDESKPQSAIPDADSHRETKLLEKEKKWSQIEMNGLPNLVISTPDGTQVKVGYESTNDNDDESTKTNLILQMTQCTTSLLHSSNESLVSHNREINRYITQNGCVVCVFTDDKVKILYPDGSVAETTINTEMETVVKDAPPDPEISEPIAKETSGVNKKKTKHSKPNIHEAAIQQEKEQQEQANKKEPELSQIRQWIVTMPNGERFSLKTNLDILTKRSQAPKEEEEGLAEGEDKQSATSDQNKAAQQSIGNENKEECVYVENCEQTDTIPVSTATDPSTQEMMLTRSDKTVVLTTPAAGIYLAEHEDGTRFTKYLFYEKSNRSNQTNSVIEVIMIESKIYPVVSINRTDGSIETRFGSMGSLLSQKNGQHVFRHSDSTEIEYRDDGEILFTPSLLQSMEFLQPMGSCSYVLNQSNSGSLICQLIDSDGTQFVVNRQGDYKIIPAKSSQLSQRSTQRKSAEKETLQDNADNSSETNTKKSSSAISMEKDREFKTVPRKQEDTMEVVGKLKQYELHAPRLFLINKDLSGSELLRYRDIVEFLVTAEMNEEYMQCKEELQDYPQIDAFTIFHPIQYKKPWQYNYSRKSILPTGLTCRDLKSFPINQSNNHKQEPIEIEDDSSQLDTKIDYRSTWKNPMLFRQFYHYRILTEDARIKLNDGLIQYNHDQIIHDKQYKEMEIVDDRTDQESQRSSEIQLRYIARNLNQQVLENAVNQILHPTQPKEEQQQNMNLDETVGVDPNPQSDQQDEQQVNMSKQKKLEVIMEKQKIERELEIKQKEALKQRSIPSFFTSIYGREFVSNQAMDLKTLNEIMKIYPNSREISAKKEDDNNQEPAKEDEKEPDLTERNSQTTSKDFENIKMGSSKMSFNKPITKKKRKSWLYYDNNLVLPEIQKRLPDSSDLDLPNYMYQERPSIGPNYRQARIEDPVRLQVKTTSLIGGPRLGQVFQRQTRGLNVLPARCDAGILREGSQYTCRFKLINTGPEACRFKVTQPKAGGWLWAEFLPGPIPAGLSRTINVHIYGIASVPDTAPTKINGSGVTLLQHDLTVTTETDILKIPVIARVMIGEDYDQILSQEATMGTNEKASIKQNIRRQTITLSK